MNDLLCELRKSESERFLHRVHCVILVLAGYDRHKIAETFGDSPRAITYWVKRYRESGLSGLQEERTGGRPAQLTPHQMDILRKALAGKPKGAKQWTSKMVKEFIVKRFEIALSVRQALRIWRVLGAQAKSKQ